MANPENKQIPYESTQKDIRDAIESVAMAIGGIAIPSADHVSYDNSGSGLSATDVQNALDEIVSDIPTVNNGTLTIQQNGTSKGSFTANSASNVNVNIETPTADKKTATDQFNTADGGLLSKCMIDLVPVQSGSGDPYPAGGGKNKFDGTSVIQANIQSNGTIGNVSVNNRVIYCKCSPNTTYTISKTVGTTFRIACYSSEPTNGSTSIGTVTTDNTASSITITTDASATYIGAWVWNSSDSLTADQMLATCQIELGNQATPYAPPSNIRPISGHTEVDLDVKDGDNVTQHTYQVPIGSTVYGRTVDLVSGVMTIDRKYKKGFTRGAIDSSGKLYKIDELSDAVNITSSSGVADLDESNMGIFLGLIPARASADFCLSHYATSFYVGGMVGKETELDALLPNLEIVYELATPQTIQLTPQQIETLAGQNNLSTPLSGQSIETNGVEYKELFTFADVKSYVDKKIPDAPTTDGTYTLQAVVSGGVPTYSWV